ncbi:MAG: hypothetical protein EHM42_06065 [Planctomycetaceae bacterium]|nr:MAG: hypothetical protein EHM42_06065 [Planctomycetaceae bacterium]
MSSDSNIRRPAAASLTLCAACVFARTVVSGRGSQFLLCRKSLEDARYAKYPPQPVRTCPGFALAPADLAASTPAGASEADRQEFTP